MNLLLGLANLSTTGLILAGGGAPVEAPNPVASPPPVEEKKVTLVTVQPGDFLSKIANQYTTTWQRIYDANIHIEHPDIINHGEQVRIPEPDEELLPRPLPTPPEPAPPVATQTSKAPTAPKPRPTYAPVSGGGVWDRLAQCESGGNWSINTGNGYYGGLQFKQSTWQSVGGSGLPSQASREEQIARAEILLARSGWGQWPACSSKLGLR